MTWVRIDDGAPLHPKLLEAGPEACWLWVCGLAHCNRSTTDGVIRKVFLPSLFPDGTWSLKKLRELAEVLVRVRLWHDEGDVYRVHDYEVQQELALKENVEARREHERSRKRKRRRELRDTSTKDTDACPVDVPDSVPDKSGTAPGEERDTGVGNRGLSQHPDPSRPVPTRPDAPSERDAREGPGIVRPLRRDPMRAALERRVVEPDALTRYVAEAWAERHKSATGRGLISSTQLEQVLRGTHMAAHQPIADAISALASWAAEEADPEEAVRAALDGFFGDPYADTCDPRFPPGLLAKHHARYATTPRRKAGQVAPHSEHDQHVDPDDPWSKPMTQTELEELTKRLEKGPKGRRYAG